MSTLHFSGDTKVVNQISAVVRRNGELIDGLLKSADGRIERFKALSLSLRDEGIKLKGLR